MKTGFRVISVAFFIMGIIGILMSFEDANFSFLVGLGFGIWADVVELSEKL